MSTSFEVYPTIQQMPTYSDVLKRTDELLEQRLNSLGIRRKFSLRPTLLSGPIESNIDVHDVMDLNKDEYVRISVPGTEGGFYLYMTDNEQVFRDLWEDELSREQSKRLETHIMKSLAQKSHWSIVRYAGTDALYNLAYGMFACALAEITEGIIFSDDNAWEYDKFPCLPQEFLEFYFNPETASDPLHKTWANDTIKILLKYY